MSEWIKKYPLCFQAFLADEEFHKDLYEYDEEAFYRESLIGTYLNWFLEKSGKDKKIEKLKAENNKLRYALEFYADTNNWHLNAINPCDQDHVIGGLLARKVLKELGNE